MTMLLAALEKIYVLALCLHNTEIIDRIQLIRL